MVDATAEDLIQNRRIERHEQRLDSFENQIEKLTVQLNTLTVQFAPFKVIADVLVDLRKTVELLHEKKII